jgi:NAD(P)-dependent dehydrogenase (short-subunit alcohol dehydrogenase family)
MQEQNICLITGATSGIGKETAKILAQKGFNLILLTRNVKKAEKIKKEILSRVGIGKFFIEIIFSDLNSLESVRLACKQIKEKYSSLSVLINNAGIFTPRKKLTIDNLELTMAINHFSHFLLTIELLPLLSKNSDSRIINVSSVGHYKADTFPIDDLNFEKKYSGFMAYRISKLANILFTYSLADKLKEKGLSITVNALHPGVVRTNIARNFPIVGWLWKINPKYINAKKGSETSVFLATDPSVEKTTGKYFSKKKEKKTSEQSYNKELQQKLWNKSLQITKASWN